MLVIGARFRTLAAARAALRGVRSSVPVPSGDVAVRPLGSTSYDAPEEVFLLAGRFDAADAATVVEIVHSQGGRVIERRPERPRPNPAPDTTQSPTTAAAPARTPARFRSRIPSPPTAPVAGAIRHARAENRRRRPTPPLRLRAARGVRLEG